MTLLPAPASFFSAHLSSDLHSKGRTRNKTTLLVTYWSSIKQQNAPVYSFQPRFHRTTI